MEFFFAFPRGKFIQAFLSVEKRERKVIVKKQAKENEACEPTRSEPALSFLAFGWRKQAKQRARKTGEGHGFGERKTSLWNRLRTKKSGESRVWKMLLALINAVVRAARATRLVLPRESSVRELCVGSGMTFEPRHLQAPVGPLTLIRQP